MDHKKTVGEILRAKREAKGLLLRQVAAMSELADILDIEREELLIQYLREKIAIELRDERLADKTRGYHTRNTAQSYSSQL
ncbi:MAG TPA: hypothetical protein VFS25_01965 [Chitinophaga sp.]|uniref:hypothetical protein n=1 Tax=Chitinophaga sp. TaxID=1869181 RepID=UPI002DBE8D9D|nr:hypothetical protein [Chitinophaga sp.]HEU4551563.1 hypothetical protein [Chitinophaga sp.]